MIDTRSLSEPSVLFAMAAFTAFAVALTLAVVRTVQAPAKKQNFTEAMSMVFGSEIDIDTALNNDTKQRRSWGDYWFDLASKTGRKFDDPQTPGLVASTVVLLGAAVGWLVVIGGPFGAIVVASALVLALRGVLMLEANKRVGAMEKQLPLLLSSLRSHLQSGATAQQALLLVAEDIPSPLGDELDWLKRDLNVNVSLDVALDALAQRVPSREMQFLVSSVEIAVRAGEYLDPQLQRIQEIVAQRTRIRQKLRSAVAQARPTQIVGLIAVPGFFLHSLTTPENLDYWTTTGQGFVLACVAGALFFGGIGVMRWMTARVEQG